MSNQETCKFNTKGLYCNLFDDICFGYTNCVFGDDKCAEGENS